MQRQKQKPDIQLSILYSGRQADMETEQELIDYANHNQITAFRIEENEDGKFHLFFKLDWKPEKDCVLASARKDMRAWSSLNTLITFIKKLKAPKVTITIVPHYPKGKKK